MYVGVNVYTHLFLIMVTPEGEWLASYPGSLPSQPPCCPVIDVSRFRGTHSVGVSLPSPGD